MKRVENYRKYYLLLNDGQEVIDYREPDLEDKRCNTWHTVYDEDIIEVLAPVPTFDEWQASEKYNKHLEEVIKVYERKDKQATETSIAYNELLEEYQKLKESREELNSYIVDKAYENAMLKAEYEKECHRADDLEDSYWKEVEKNKKLKELLKEIRSKIKIVYDFDTREFTNTADYDNDLLTKIDEVLK